MNYKEAPQTIRVRKVAKVIYIINKGLILGLKSGNIFMTLDLQD